MLAADILPDPAVSPPSLLHNLPLAADFSGRILIVRRDNIGDLVCTTPLFEALRESFPAAHLAALVNSYNAPVLSGNQALDAVHVYTKLKHRSPGQSLWAPLLARFRLILALRRQRFDVALLAKSGFDVHGLNFVRQLGIPRVVGFAPLVGDPPRALSCPVPAPDNDKLHEVEALWQLLEPLGVRGKPGPLRLYPALDAVDDRRRRFGLNRPLVAVHVSAREASRRLGEDKWISVLRQLAMAVPAGRLVLVWSPGDEEDPRHPGDDRLAARLQAALASVPGAILMPAPTATLPELMATLGACDLFIGADGGAMHVAVGLGLPTVGLFENSPFKLRHWAPWQVPSEQVPSPTFAIGDTDPESIVAATLRLLARTRPSS